MATISVRGIVWGAVGLLIVFLLMATMILPQFQDAYEHCGINDPYSAGRGGTDLNNACCTSGSSTVVACANCNTTTAYETFLTTCDRLISAVNGTHCYKCNAFGYKSTNQGLLLLVLVIAMVGMAVTFLWYRR